MRLALLLLLLCIGCASFKPVPWALRGVGAVAAFALHEGCHLALGAAFGADFELGWRGAGPNIEWTGLEGSEQKAVAFIGNACTGLAAEYVVNTDAKKKPFWQGVAWFHALNAFGYAFVPWGDASHFYDAGGSKVTWMSVNAGHALRVAISMEVMDETDKRKAD